MSNFTHHENNEHLVVTNEELLKKQKQELLRRLRKGEDIYVFFDTETTGTEPFPKKRENGTLINRDRVIEVGFLFYGVNEQGKLEQIIAEGKPVTFHEYINPQKENEEELKRFNSNIPVNDEFGIIRSYKRQDIPFEPFLAMYKNKLNNTQLEKVNPTLEGLRALLVHGISLDFLNGEGELGGRKLPKPAPTFSEIRPYMDDILCFDELTDEDIKGKMIGIGHNSISFDNTFLGMEMERDDMKNDMVESPRLFETMISDSKDTMHMMQELWDRNELKELNNPEKPFNVYTASGDAMKPGYSMSYLAYMLGVEETGREEFHGALLDSEILADCFSKLLEHPKYLAAPNKLPIPAPIHDFLNKKMTQKYSLDKIEQQELGSEVNVLNLIQTDASLQEGTGTISEYISRAKEVGLNNLAMIDVVSMMNFVPFYEKCKENDIKPIVGTTFKLESKYDVSFYFGNLKKMGVYDSINNITKTILAESSVQINDLETFLNDNNVYKMVEITEYVNIINDLYEKVRDKKADSSIKKDENSLKTKLINLLNISGISFDEKYIKDVNKKDKEILKTIVKTNPIKTKIPTFNRVSFYHDITVIANNDEGLQSLRYLITKTQKEGKYFLAEDKGLAKGEYPLTDIKFFDDPKNIKGLTLLIGDSGDVLGRALKSKDQLSSIGIINDLKSKFENVVFDVNSKMSHADERMKRGEAVYMKMINDILPSAGIPAIATHHASFANADDYEAHLNKASILLDYKVDSLIVKPNRYKGQFLQNKDELETIFANNKGLMNNAFLLINNSNISPELHNPKLPEFPTPNGEDQTEYFISQVRRGFDVKVSIAFDNYVEENNIEQSQIKSEKEAFYKKYEERLQYELDIIIDMGFPGYFLITQDAINFCKKQGIVVGAGRGSGAGSLVVYSLGITAIDPIEHGLIFERFLNPERVEMPDIDTDLEDKEELVKYLEKKYSGYGDGASAAAYIITKGSFSAKSTIKAIGKTKKLPVQWQNNLADMIPNTPDVTIEESLDENEKLLNRYQSEAMTKSVIDDAIMLEKVHRQKSTGKHAGGVVVGNLVGTAPIEYEKGLPVIQYDKNNVEAAGAVKFDFLGLGTLTVVNKAIKNVIKSHGVDALEKYGIKIEGNYVNADAIKYNDKAVYDLIKTGKTSNLFQIESSGMSDLAVKIQPENLEEISAMLALFRPGPLESGMVDIYLKGKRDPDNIKYLKDEREPESMKYDTDFLAPILKSTYGAILYQEQVMKIANDMAGYSLGGADKLRKAMGKKKPEEMEKQRGIFVEGSLKNGYSEDLANFVFNKMEKFAGYGFNKSHSIAYADLTYKTALLKANFPKEFMAAVLTCDANGNNSVVKINKSITATRELNIRVTPPEINISELDFVTSTKGIAYGLSGVKGATFNKVIENRQKNGEFKNIMDMLLRMNSKEASKSVMESLIKGGALDTLPLSSKPQLVNMEELDTPLLKRAAKRAMLMAEYHNLKDLLSSAVKKKEFVPENFEMNYQVVLNDIIKDKSFSVKNMLHEENEILSSYVSGHPLDIGGMRNKLKDPKTYPVLTELSDLKEYDDYKEYEEIRLAGIIKNGAFDAISAKGNKYSKITLDDGTSEHNLFLFEGNTEAINTEMKSKLGRKLRDGDIISILGKFQMKENKRSGKDEMNLNIDFVELPEYPELGCIQVNDFAKPYKKRAKSQYQP